jgi:hypothetical protein
MKQAQRCVTGLSVGGCVVGADLANRQLRQSVQAIDDLLRLEGLVDNRG